LKKRTNHHHHHLPLTHSQTVEKFSMAAPICFSAQLLTSFGHRRTKMKEDRCAITDEHTSFLLTQWLHAVSFPHFHATRMKVF
jgi:hypothetical protein